MKMGSYARLSGEFGRYDSVLRLRTFPSRPKRSGT